MKAVPADNPAVGLVAASFNAAFALSMASFVSIKPLLSDVYCLFNSISVFCNSDGFCPNTVRCAGCVALGCAG
jgi:hypothetical protein